ncbi:MAG: DUF4982 domain-containing protein [Atopobiaceae bacterium]|nr:DUF4982 domain-containing protein [Atopobiaceae bacterium]
MQTIELAEGWSFWRNAEGTGEAQRVRVPQDAMLSEPRSADAPTGSAGSYFPGGIYRYERTIEVLPAWEGCSLVLGFEGVYRNATVLVDGEKRAFHAYGYTGFTVEVCACAHAGDAHTVAVIADNSAQPNSRWYSGSGIYRPVRLHVLPPRRIALDGVRVTTLSADPARIKVETAADDGAIKVEIVREGAVVACGEGSSCTLEVPDAALWSAEHPDLYEARVALMDGDEELDSRTVRFGIRTLSWGVDGLFVNGESIKLRGGCIHHDNGILGAVDLREASYRKVALLKQWGFNAIRSSHNPISESMLDACDELGMYVMDEFADMWFTNKNPYDYALDFEACHEADLAAMVAKDFNRPSVIMYSIGNENSEPGTERGVECAGKLAEIVRSLDPSRPVTAGVNLTILFSTTLGMDSFNADGEKEANQPKGSALYNLYVTKLGSIMNLISRLPMVGWANEPFFQKLDICGYNYATIRYAHDLRKHPERLFVGSETMCYDIAKNWRMVEKHPRLLGDFMWTALDYLGEVSLAGWSEDPEPMIKPFPWICADSGALDLIGKPNGEAAMAAVTWDAPAAEAGPLIYVRPCNLPDPVKAPWRGTNSVPSWTWLGCDGVKTTVEVYTKAPIVKLYQDGRHIWTKRTYDNHADFTVAYRPGTLRALACTSDGSELSRAELSTAEGPLGLFLAREGVGALQPGDIAFVDVVLGREGVPEGNADRPVTVEVEGGELLAFGSAAQKSECSYLSGTYPTRYGRALAIVRVDEPGACTVRATAESGLAAELAL